MQVKADVVIIAMTGWMELDLGKNRKGKNLRFLKSMYNTAYCEYITIYSFYC